MIQEMVIWVLNCLGDTHLPFLVQAILSTSMASALYLCGLEPQGCQFSPVKNTSVIQLVSNKISKAFPVVKAANVDTKF